MKRYAALSSVAEQLAVAIRRLTRVTRFSVIGSCVAAATFSFASQTLGASENPSAAEAVASARSLPWTQAPAEVDLAGKAHLKLSGDLEYLAPPNSTEFIKLNGNPPPDSDMYIVSRKDWRWFSGFTFEPSGYVRDDEKIDPDKLLADLQKGNQAGAAQRKQLGLSPLNLVGWYVPPHYDKTTHRLEWGTKLVDESNNITVNYTVRLLSRTGVMSATLVSEPKNLDHDVEEFKQSLNDIKFNSGETYSEFRNGDKIAAYGLGALVVGGAAAVAVKTGAGLIKAVAVAVLGAFAAAVGWLKNLFSRRKKAQ